MNMCKFVDIVIKGRKKNHTNVHSKNENGENDLKDIR